VGLWHHKAFIIMAPQIHPNLREQRGQEMAQVKDSVKRLDDRNYQSLQLEI